MAIAKKLNPELWKESVDEAMKKYNNIRSAWMYAYASKLYKEKGGKYGDNTRSNSLKKWINSEWGTKTGGDPLLTGERYLPKKIIQKLTPEEYERTSKKKLADLKKGIKVSEQPPEIKKKVSKLMKKLNLG